MAPVKYIPNYISPDHFGPLWEHLPWKQMENVPRKECWMNDYGLPYTYGSGAFSRTYEAEKQWHPFIKVICDMLNNNFRTSYNCCFINGYEHGRHHLGWHSDDSPEMDLDHPIAVISLGSTREIWFREKVGSIYGPHELELLGPGSLLIMEAGMQRTWQHRIPKSSLNDCGPRLSMTFRRLIYENYP